MSERNGRGSSVRCIRLDVHEISVYALVEGFNFLEANFASENDRKDGQRVESRQQQERCCDQREDASFVDTVLYSLRLAPRSEYRRFRAAVHVHFGRMRHGSRKRYQDHTEYEAKRSRPKHYVLQTELLAADLPGILQCSKGFSEYADGAAAVVCDIALPALDS